MRPSGQEPKGWSQVADGHGHSRHLRSDRGSKLAVAIGCQVAQELADRLEAKTATFAQPNPAAAAAAMAGEITKLIEEFLVPAVVSRWREAVLADLNADPFAQAEQAKRYPGDDATIAYGSTLLLCIVLHNWLMLAQIGDGDVVGVRADGRAVEPVPDDPQLDGLVTTSLCGSDPRADFRIAAVDASQKHLRAVLLATDGYGNAQVVEEWPQAFSEDLGWMLRERDAAWLASQLPSWAARCASPDGSGDDTTIALLISPASAKRRAGEQGEDAEVGSEETTIPAVPHAATVPIQIPVAPPIDPVTVRQLAHRTMPEPVILERSIQPPSHEPDTTEIPSVWRGESGDDVKNDGARPSHDDSQSSGDPGDEPPATEWRPPGNGGR